MNIDLAVLKRGAVAATLILGAQVSQAASLGLTTSGWDLTTAGASLDYTFTDICLGVDGSTTGACGTDNGLNGKSNVVFDGALDAGLSSGQLVIGYTGNQTLTDPAGTIGYVGGGSYSLIANFDGAGNFTGGTVSATGTEIQGWTDFQSGTIVTGDLTDFGWSGANSAGFFEFTYNNITGDFGNLWGGSEDGPGIIISTSTLSPSAVDWDADLDFQADINATSANVDTFVPVPAAVWLFGSGLIGLAGWGRRGRRQT
jgi:hypothetical protein